LPALHVFLFENLPQTSAFECPGSSIRKPHREPRSREC
jgi:hypothetical protein